MLLTILSLLSNARGSLYSKFVFSLILFSINKTEIDDAAAYVEKIYEKLKAIIEEQLNTVVDSDEIAHEQSTKSCLKCRME